MRTVCFPPRIPPICYAWHFVHLMRCTFEELQDGFIHMLPNWQLGLLGDLANLHSNVNLFLPHNCLYKIYSEAPKSVCLRGTIMEREIRFSEAEWELTWPKKQRSVTECDWATSWELVHIHSYAWASVVWNHISPKFYGVNQTNYVVQCAKTFYGFLFLSTELSLYCTIWRCTNYLIMGDSFKMWGSNMESQIAALKIYASFLPHQPMCSRVEFLWVL